MDKYRFFHKGHKVECKVHKCDMSFEYLVLKGWVFDMKLQEFYGSTNQHFQSDYSPDKG